MMIRRPEAGLAALAGTLALLILLPVLLRPYLPFEDLPNHIARRALMAAPEGPLAEYFTFRPGLGTNMAADLLWQVFGPLLGDPARFARLTAAVAMLGFPLSVAVLHRVVQGHWSGWPLASALLVHNANFLWGFENFVLTLPLALLGLALWIGTRDRGVALRIVATLGMVAALYLGHLLALLAYALLVGGYEAGMALRGRRIDLRAVNWPGLAVVAAACLAHLRLMAEAPAPGYGSETTFGTLAQRLEIVTSPFGTMGTGSLLQPLAGMAPWIIGLAVLLLIAARRAGVALRLAPALRGPLIVLGLAVLLMPAQLQGVYLTHLRFPTLLVGLALAAIDPALPGPRVKAALAVLLVLLVAGRSLILDRAAGAYAAEVAALERVAADLPAGARVLPVVMAGLQPQTTKHFHTQAYLVPRAQAFVPTLFVGGSHSLVMAEGWQDLSAPQPSAVPFPVLMRADWPEAFNEPWAFVPGWQGRFTHILVLGPMTEAEAARLPARRIAQDGAFTLFAVTP